LQTPEYFKKQLDSLEDLRSIVRTMKALSAASIRQYEAAVESLRDYYRTVELGMHVVLTAGHPALPSPAEQPTAGGVGAVVFGSDHGLCGRFNEDVVAHALGAVAELTPGGTPRRFVSVGARAAAQLEAEGMVVDKNFWVPGAASRITATVRQVLLELEAWQSERGIGRIYLFHNGPSDEGRYRPVALQLLPVRLDDFRHREAERWPSRRLPSFSMERDALFASLLRQYFFVTLFRACAESQASEHASRLASMQAAEKNLDERVESVTSQFRRVRQTAITSELLDVVSGFEATQ
jgi:F-type H+-transporting ATPase subunit gamma